MAMPTSTSSTVKPFSAGREEDRPVFRIRISPLYDQSHPLPLHDGEARRDTEPAEEHGQSHEGDAHGDQHVQQDVAVLTPAASVSAAALQSSHDAMSLSLPSPPSAPSAPKDNRPKGSPLGPGTAYTYAWPQGSATIFLFT